MKTKHIVKIEKLVFGGQALARLKTGQTVFIWNALPGETVEIEIITKKRNYLEATAKKIIIPSKDRIEPQTSHYLSTSAWEIITPKKEKQYKIEIAQETYKKIGLFETPNLTIESLDKNFEYRNKIEYSFCDKNFIYKTRKQKELEKNTANKITKEDISLAFYERGGKDRIPVTNCKLATKEINKTTAIIFNWIKQQNIPKFSLKTLIIRSNTKGETIAALFLKDKLELNKYPKITNKLLGFQIYYSNHLSPISRPDQLIFSSGQNYLLETINLRPIAKESQAETLLNNPQTKYKITTLKYGILSFFQINAPIFEKTLEDISKFLDKNKSIVDFYSGVGAISIPLNQYYKNAILVDNNQEAINYAKENIKQNNLKNCKAHCIPAEKMTKIISKEKIIILDPPRAGLHKDVTKKLLEKIPERIIYLSCNLSTQARDISNLLPNYNIIFSKLYNYFPRTPHIEGLIVLDKKT